MKKTNLRLEAAIPASLLAACIAFLPVLAFAQDRDGSFTTSSKAQYLPNTGQFLTPLAPPGARFQPLNPNLADSPEYIAGQAVTAVKSPDQRTLLILTSGYNLLSFTSGPNLGKDNLADSNEYVFVYDISSPTPIKRQVIQVPNTYNGIVFDPSGTAFYVSGGMDDNVHTYTRAPNGSWVAGVTVSLGHTKTGNGLRVQPAAAGLDITGDGSTLVVANYYNDSISILTRSSGEWAKTGELDLRPGKIDPTNATGVAGGEYPFWVTVKDNNTAYISSIRDREIDVVTLGDTPALTARIKVAGQPLKMTLNASQSRLYVVEDQTDAVDVIDTNLNQVIDTITNVGTPPGILPPTRAGYTGANPNSVAISPDGQTLYVTDGNTNSVSVVALSDAIGGNRVLGLIPTGWYPNSISFSADGRYAYVVNGKSPTGANPEHCKGIDDEDPAVCNASNQYVLQLVKAGFQTFPLPDVSQLNGLTRQVVANNHWLYSPSASEARTMAFLRRNIKHVIYVVKENRTYDQVLGDLEVGNGDPDQTEFGEAVTPNFHNLARNFVTLDNFYDTGEVSMDGWPWTVGARAPDVVERQFMVNYADRGLSYDSEGTNRNVNVSLATLNQRLSANPVTPSDPDLLPGQTDTAAPDGPDNELNTGHLWDAALRAGLSVRNYGFFIDLARYTPGLPGGLTIPELIDPFSAKRQVAYPTNAALRPYTDLYYRGYDNAFPDYYRFQEFSRDFDARYAKGRLPRLTLVRFPHDHTGAFGSAILGVNTPDLQLADNDYAVGLLVQKIAQSQYKNDTLIFVIEDDSQDGADHVDAHRSTAFIAGPYVRQNAVVSSFYNTLNMIRTMEQILGLPALNLNDSVAAPMADVFDTSLNPAAWTYNAVPSDLLYNTQLPLPPRASAGNLIRPARDASYWAAMTKGMDFSVEDHLDSRVYKQVLWKGLMGDKRYPLEHAGKNFRLNREALLSAYHAGQEKQANRSGNPPEVKQSRGSE